MCGIAGIFSYRNNSLTVDHNELIEMRESMFNRGPDGEGLWISIDKKIGLAHRRLSIIDLSETGSQPMHSRDGNLHIVFNGEIYNYLDLRNYLQNKGFNFKSTSDTEVLLSLYQDKGVEMLSCLRGMYAFAIWDEINKRLFLARDPFGIKPLYFSNNGNVLKFSSQVKTLLKCKDIDTSIDPAGHVGFFLWGSVPEPFTMYNGIQALKAGSYLLVDRAGNKIEKSFCNIPQELSQDNSIEQNNGKIDIKKRLHEALSDSIKYHMVSDVPVGLFLSSGLDSATITALAAEISLNKLNTITLGFSEYKGTMNDETIFAEKLSDYYGTQHETKWVTKDDFKSEFENFFKAMDQPTIDGVNTYFVSKVAADAGMKVALSGLGGDELFGGYPSFKNVPSIAKLFLPLHKFHGIGKTIRIISEPLLKHFVSPKYAGLLEYGGTWGGAYLLRRGLFMPWELPDLLDPEIVKSGWSRLQPLICLEDTVKNIIADRIKVSALEMCWYMRNQLLRDADWAGMAHSLEIRVPLVDLELLRHSAFLLNKGFSLNKQDMVKAIVKPLPQEIVSRPKTGFSVPIREWMAEDNIEANKDRGLRGWALKVFEAYKRI
jgi:asparagine synthase (glutamine-hydrolysing)